MILIKSILITLFVCSSAFAQSNLKLEKFKLSDGIIWAAAFLPDGKILFTERAAKLKIYDPSSKTSKEVSGLPKIYVSGQAGLLDLIIDSDFKKNNTIYFSYSKETAEDQYTTAVYSAKLKQQKLVEGKDIFVAKTDSGKSHHFGSRIRETKDGYLFLSVGDRGKRDEAQSLKNHHGKILRITKDGKAAPNNPFIKDKNALPEIYSYGHRNPQGMDYDSASDELWINEHGPRGGDEINKVEPGKNYGWPVITYGKEYWGPSIGDTHKEGMEQPVYYYVPSIATSGLVKYRGNKFKAWKGNFFSGALKGQHLNRAYYDQRKKKYADEKLAATLELDQRIRSVIHTPDNEMAFTTDNGNLYFVK
ncbi:MAG: dehydrogenase [Bdellovibrionaceae bacterium]|nr:dehydrogenase [Pseudobdellovibrionaceae bacterium]|tara:strand:- start:47 stop:1132 length:1086 start_codon:yes stop_codon:yes gene_type:complete